MRSPAGSHNPDLHSFLRPLITGFFITKILHGELMTDDFNNYKTSQSSFSKYSVLQCQTNQVKQKSYAQVESLVLPQVVLPNSCGLKPEMSSGRRKTQKKPAKRARPLSVRLSDKERAIIIQKAFNIGYNVNAYVRAAALGSGYTPPHEP